MNAQRDTRHVFVLDRYTGLFLSAEGFWTSDFEAARDFNTTPHAVAHCLTQRISDAQIAIAIEAGEKCITTVLRLPDANPTMGRTES